MENPMISEAKEQLYFLSHNERERAIYEARMKFHRDQLSRLKWAEEQAKIKGWAEGEMEAMRKMAKKLKALGTSPEIIMQATSLSLKDIKNLG